MTRVKLVLEFGGQRLEIEVDGIGCQTKSIPAQGFCGTDNNDDDDDNNNL